jgi:RNA polymerase sigma-70 factor (ECF subfamily)
MYAYIYRRVGDANLAEDLTSELFMRLLLAVQNGNIWKQSFTAWLYRVAHNLVVDHYRKRPPLTEDLEVVNGISAASGADEMVEQSMAVDQLFQGVQQLTPEQQEVLVLRFGEGLTAKEVGEIIGKSTGAVEALQRRGIAGLRRIMNRGEEDDDGS